MKETKKTAKLKMSPKMRKAFILQNGNRNGNIYRL